jgi:hypothetical protein
MWPHCFWKETTGYLQSGHTVLLFVTEVYPRKLSWCSFFQLFPTPGVKSRRSLYHTDKALFEVFFYSTFFSCFFFLKRKAKLSKIRRKQTLYPRKCVLVWRKKQKNKKKRCIKIRKTNEKATSQNYSKLPPPKGPAWGYGEASEGCTGPKGPTRGFENVAQNTSTWGFSNFFWM